MKVRRSTAKEERAFTKVKRLAGVTKKVGVAKGYGPGHAENAAEGEEVDPRKVMKLQGGGAVPEFLAERDLAGEANADRMAEKQQFYDELDEALQKRGVPPLRSLLEQNEADPLSVPVFREGHWQKLRHYHPEYRAGERPEMARKGRVAVGPRHADNAHNTDTVPAMLTPREAVLNRNAAELAGRQNIEQLNAEGNKLAGQGVDLAGGGHKPMKKQKLAEGGAVHQPAKAKNPPGYLGPPEQMPGLGLTRPDHMPGLGRDQGNVSAGGPNAFGGYAQNVNQWGVPYGWERQREGGGMPGVGRDGPYPMPARPMPLPMPIEPGIGGGGVLGHPGGGGVLGHPGGGVLGQPQGVLGSGGGPASMPSLGGGFYPPDQGPFGQKAKKPLGMQSGSTEVQPIGTPPTGQVYGPPIQLSAPDILSKLQAAGKEQGLSTAQINGLMQAFKGAGQAFSGGGGAGTYYGSEGAAMGAAMGQLGYSGGISDIGYPPFVAPTAAYHGDKGGWQGRYDPNYFIPNYG